MKRSWQDSGDNAGRNKPSLKQDWWQCFVCGAWHNHGWCPCQSSVGKGDSGSMSNAVPKVNGQPTGKAQENVSGKSSGSDNMEVD